MRTAAFLLTIVFLLASATARAQTPAGSVIVARTGDAALILWDATPEVAQATSDRANAADTMHQLEAKALDILHTKGASLAHSSTITVRVVYTRSAVSEVYHAATFEGLERVFELTAPRLELTKNYDKLAADAAKGQIDAPLVLKVTGSLPPSS